LNLMKFVPAHKGGQYTKGECLSHTGL